MTLTHDTQIQTVFRLVDDAGNTLGRHVEPVRVLDALTPQALLNLYESLHARRNAARREAGLPEIGLPDVAVVLLEAMRRLGDTGSIERCAEVVGEVVAEIARERGGGPEPPHRPGWPKYPCPSCKAINDIRGWDPDAETKIAVCACCGNTHTEREWMAQIFVPDQTNGREPAEVTG